MNKYNIIFAIENNFVRKKLLCYAKIEDFVLGCGGNFFSDGLEHVFISENSRTVVDISIQDDGTIKVSADEKTKLKYKIFADIEYVKIGCNTIFAEKFTLNAPPMWCFGFGRNERQTQEKSECAQISTSSC